MRSARRPSPGSTSSHGGADDSRHADRTSRIAQAVAALDAPPAPAGAGFALAAEVFTVEEARIAADAGATEIAFDPFLRHPVPAARKVASLAEELTARGVALRLRLPSIVRPEERDSLTKWLALDLPVLTGHAGYAVELAAAGRDVVADYAVNVFNQHTAAEFFRRGVRRLALSIELTTEEIARRRRAVEGRRLRGDRLRPARGDDDRALRALGRVRSRRDHLPRSLRAEASRRWSSPTRRATPSRWPPTRSAATGCCIRGRWRRPSSCRSSGGAGSASYRLLFNVPGDPVAEIVARWRVVARRARSGALAGAAPRSVRWSAASSRAATSSARSDVPPPHGSMPPRCRAQGAA